MAKVIFTDQNLEVEVPLGSSLLQAAKKIGAPGGDACGGVCACSTCHMYVDEGREFLSDAEEEEEDILDKAFDVRMTSRLGCQAKVKAEGLLKIRISKESIAAYFNEHPEKRG